MLDKVNEAVSGDVLMAVYGAVWEIVSGAVERAVWEAVYWAVVEAVYEAVYGAVNKSTDRKSWIC